MARVAAAVKAYLSYSRSLPFRPNDGLRAGLGNDTPPQEIFHLIWRVSKARHDLPRMLPEFGRGHWTGLLHTLDLERAVDRADGAKLRMLEGTDTKAVVLPPRSPNLNPQIERFMLSLKSECLERMIFFGEKSLRKALSQYQTHYHAERNHQGLKNEIIEPGVEVGCADGEVHCRNRLGGMLRYYYREAA